MKTALRSFGGDALFALALLTAAPDSRSLCSGGSLAVAAYLLLCWISGYPEQKSVIRGPYRFVRHPRLLLAWLCWLGICLAARSFPALLCCLILLPLLYAQDPLDAAEAEALDLDERRYLRFVPALVPTVLPYPRSAHAGRAQPYSWRRSLFRWDDAKRGMLLVLLFAAASASLSPYVPFWICALGWCALRLSFWLYRRRFAA